MSYVKHRLKGVATEDLAHDLARIQALCRVYPTSKVEYAVELAVAAIKDEIVRRNDSERSME